METQRTGNSGGGTDAPSVATFISKVWKIVGKPEYKPLVSWAENGKTFIIHNHSQFSQQVLPLYFKHNNFTSFVRQLNLYGFRKVAKPDHGSLARAQLNEPVEFWHTNFRKGHPELLHLVQRRSVPSHSGSEQKQAHLSKVIGDIHQMKERQETIASVLDVMKRDNEHLRRELVLLKDKHLRQQRVLNKIIQFLVHMVYEGKLPGTRRRSNQLMLTEGERVPSPSPKRMRREPTPEIDISAYEVQSPRDLLNSPMSVQMAPAVTSPPVSPQASSAVLPSSLENNPPLPPSTSMVSLPFILPSDQPPVTTTALAPLSTFPSSSEVVSGTTPVEDLAITIPQDLLAEFALNPPPQSLVTPANDSSCKNCLSGHIDYQQQGLEAFPELLSGQFSIDPAIVSDFISGEYSSVPQYDITDTARLLEILGGDGIPGFPPDNALIANLSLPAIAPPLQDSYTSEAPQLEELLETIPPATAASS